MKKKIWQEIDEGSYARVGVSRITTQDGDVVNISVIDHTSGNTIVSLELTLENYAKFITGLHGVEAKYDLLVSPEGAAVLQCEREFKYQKVEHSYNKEKQSELVRKDFESGNFALDGWFIFSDGAVNKRSSKDHHYTMMRYIKPETK